MLRLLMLATLGASGPGGKCRVLVGLGELVGRWALSRNVASNVRSSSWENGWAILVAVIDNKYCRHLLVTRQTVSCP